MGFFSKLVDIFVYGGVSSKKSKKDEQRDKESKERYEQEKRQKRLKFYTDQGYTLEQAEILLAKEEEKQRQFDEFQHEIFTRLDGCSFSIRNDLVRKITDQTSARVGDSDFEEKLNKSTYYQAVKALMAFTPPENNTVSLKFLLDEQYGSALADVLAEYKCDGLSVDPIVLIKQLKVIAFYQVKFGSVENLRIDDRWQNYDEMNETVTRDQPLN